MPLAIESGIVLNVNDLPILPRSFSSKRVKSASKSIIFYVIPHLAHCFGMVVVSVQTVAGDQVNNLHACSVDFNEIINFCLSRRQKDQPKIRSDFLGIASGSRRVGTHRRFLHRTLGVEQSARFGNPFLAVSLFAVSVVTCVLDENTGRVGIKQQSNYLRRT
nr:MAG TPA: hypothetical protein [Caudoviricetes sp.]